MRSRYTAFTRMGSAYLIRTWHPDTRPACIDFDHDVAWRGLQIVDTVAGGETDDRGVVEYRASYRTHDGIGIQHERSRFTRVDGRWMYIDGDIVDD